ncbi:hypothetical protein RRF57_000586 [Xylaria bambusicola]|uniref:Uncharacterized protein n=1 Tax=Xylaria bambusicola TaxID=326684 RepID=A0AAN7U3T3_9PEZI
MGPASESNIGHLEATSGGMNPSVAMPVVTAQAHDAESASGKGKDKVAAMYVELRILRIY